MTVQLLECPTCTKRIAATNTDRGACFDCKELLHPVDELSVEDEVELYSACGFD